MEYQNVNLFIFRRLMRTVQSLLGMREPELARVSPIDNNDSPPSPVDNHRHNNHHSDVSLTLQNNGFVNSGSQEPANYARRSSSDRGNDSSSTDNDSRTCFLKSSSSNAMEVGRSLRNLPGVRRSLDATSLNSGSSKTTEEEDGLPNNNSFNSVSLTEHERIFVCASSSTPNRRVKKTEKKEKEKSAKSKPAASVSSVEDESGFSSMSSFQEIGLPSALPISPIRSYHADVGLPEMPVEKARHRRWSSTPAEIQAMFKRRSSYTAPQPNADSLSVWV